MNVKKRFRVHCVKHGVFDALPTERQAKASKDLAKFMTHRSCGRIWIEDTAKQGGKQKSRRK